MPALLKRFLFCLEILSMYHSFSKIKIKSYVNVIEYKVSYWFTSRFQEAPRECHLSLTRYQHICSKHDLGYRVFYFRVFTESNVLNLKNYRCVYKSKEEKSKWGKLFQFSVSTQFINSNCTSAMLWLVEVLVKGCIFCFTRFMMTSLQKNFPPEETETK